MPSSPEIFLSWSGASSKQIAEYLKSWLPLIVESPKLWLSSNDIPDGARWSNELFKSLERIQCGILVLTPKNLNSSWLMFEAGALSKNLDEGRVIPLLCGLNIKDINGPLAHFLCVNWEREGMLRLVLSINGFSSNPTATKVIESRFEAFWPQFSSFLNNLDLVSSHNKISESDPAFERLENRFSKQWIYYMFLHKNSTQHQTMTYLV